MGGDDPRGGRLWRFDLASLRWTALLPGGAGGARLGAMALPPRVLSAASLLAYNPASIPASAAASAAASSSAAAVAAALAVAAAVAVAVAVAVAAPLVSTRLSARGAA